VVLDYTGGPKSFTAAMVLAGAVADHRLQSVRPKELDANGRPASGTEFEVVEVDLRFKGRATTARSPARSRV